MSISIHASKFNLKVNLENRYLEHTVNPIAMQTKSPLPDAQLQFYTRINPTAVADIVWLYTRCRIYRSSFAIASLREILSSRQNSYRDNSWLIRNGAQYLRIEKSGYRKRISVHPAHSTPIKLKFLTDPMICRVNYVSEAFSNLN